MDPYGQYFSPYLGMGNNPVIRIDPDGGKTDDPPRMLDEVTVRASRIRRGFDMGFLSRIGTTSGWSNVGLGFSELSLGSESFRQFLASKDGLLSSSKLQNISKFSKFGGWATAGISTLTDFAQAAVLTFNKSPKAGDAREKVVWNTVFTGIGLSAGRILSGATPLGWGISAVYFIGSQMHASEQHPYGIWSIIKQGLIKSYRHDKAVFDMYWHKNDSFFNNMRRTFPMSGH